MKTSRERVKVVHMTSVHKALDGRIFHKECRSLARAGFEVISIGEHHDDTVVDDVQIKSVRVDQARLQRMTRTVWRIYREALRQDAHIYHFHDPELIPVGLLLRAHGKCVIYDVHENYPKDILSKHYLPGWSRRLVAWLIDQVEKQSSIHFSALVVVTPSIAERFYPTNRRTVLVFNYPYSDEVVLREHRSWGERKQAVAYVGGITVERGIRQMVAAMTHVRPTLGATLELAGPTVRDDIQVPQMEALPGWKHVNYHGKLDLPRTFRILHNVRAGLVLFHPLPNHLESMPQKLFEYMGAGIPVIASNFSFWRKIVEDSGCGLVVDPLDVPSIARAIEYVLLNPNEAEEMGRRGQAAVLDFYNWDAQAEKLVNLYRDVVN